jgi:hypothetical protein
VIYSFVIIDSIPRDLRNFRAVFFHGHPRDVINIARAVVAPGGACGSYGDLFATIAIVAVIVVQVSPKKRVVLNI